MHCNNSMKVRIYTPQIYTPVSQEGVQRSQVWATIVFICGAVPDTLALIDQDYYTYTKYLRTLIQNRNSAETSGSHVGIFYLVSPNGKWIQRSHGGQVQIINPTLINKK